MELYHLSPAPLAYAWNAVPIGENKGRSPVEITLELHPAWCRYEDTNPD